MIKKLTFTVTIIFFISIKLFASSIGRAPISVTDKVSCVGTIECQTDIFGNPNLERIKNLAHKLVLFRIKDRCSYWMQATNEVIRRNHLPNQFYNQSFVENIESGVVCYEGRSYGGGYAALIKYTCESAATGICILKNQ